MVITLVAATAAWLVSALGVLGALVFLHRLRLPRVSRAGAVTLVLPLAGEAPGLERLLAALEAQRLLPRRLIIGVESMQDPAYGRAAALADGRAFPIQVVVGGHATQSAQKCSNLIAALRLPDAEDQAVVLLDADIVPPSWWLSALVSPLLDGSADVVTGYRWPIVAAPTIGAHLAAGIDRGIALLPRPRWFRVTWGGSLALSPRALEALQPVRILATTLSDDCTIGEYAGALGLRVLNRRALLVPTPVSGDLAAVWRFGRRQYQIIRLYRPALWWLAFCALSLRLAAWGLFLAHLDSLVARVAMPALVATALAAFVVQALVGRRLDFPDPLGVQIVQALLAVFKPAVDLVHWSLVLTAAATGTVRWGHVGYRVSGPYNIAIGSRDPWA